MREWKQKYDQHKYRAERRGIPFELTFKQWLKIWQDSGHLRERGHRHGQYVMARFFGGGSYLDFGRFRPRMRGHTPCGARYGLEFLYGLGVAVT
jgi:hypothetical protein